MIVHSCFLTTESGYFLREWRNAADRAANIGLPWSTDRAGMVVASSEAGKTDQNDRDGLIGLPKEPVGGELAGWMNSLTGGKPDKPAGRQRKADFSPGLAECRRLAGKIVLPLSGGLTESATEGRFLSMIGRIAPPGPGKSGFRCRADLVGRI
ncbi:hypothetical protein [Bifidobacterium avesanii]|uniref:Uncharacterized protein n=1 Tax=Bifidobacterium avesanii TaxID=1798157 RepID=A0A7K3TFG3_9BIFI|nr:hypothetical protein [Bifidobacterium avesanii]NEG77827.1 hypothetical protein [Bifidobacterium avesanii]